MHFGGDTVVCTPEHPFFVNNTWLEVRWAHVPKMADFTIEHGWIDKIKSVQSLHNNPRTIDRMYFGVMYSGGYDSFSWKLTYRKYLSTMYSNIWLMHYKYSDFLERPGQYGAEYNKRRK